MSASQPDPNGFERFVTQHGWSPTDSGFYLHSSGYLLVFDTSSWLVLLSPQRSAVKDVEMPSTEHFSECLAKIEALIEVDIRTD